MRPGPKAGEHGETEGVYECDTRFAMRDNPDSFHRKRSPIGSLVRELASMARLREFVTPSTASGPL